MEKNTSRDWEKVLSGVYYGLLIVLLLIGLAYTETPWTMRMWHGFANVCYRLAYTCGQAGLYAEAAYWRAVETSRL